MYDRRRLSIDKIKEQVEAIDVARGSSRLKSYPQNSTSKEIDPYFETSNNFSEKPVNPFPIPYDIGNAETKYEPVINVDEDEDDVIVDTLIEDEEEEIVDLQIEVNNFQASQEPVLPKEDRKNLSHAEDKSLVYYDRETLNEEDRNIMLSAIEQHILTPQYDRAGNLYFNPTGTVSRAESINALECFGKKGKSIDGVSEESDYYNEGYNELVSSVLNNFCNLYTKENLYGNIRRCELAYMVASHPHHNFGSNVLVKDNVSNLYGYEDIKKIQFTLDKADTTHNLIKVRDYEYVDIDNYFNRVRSGEVRLPISLIILTHQLVELGYSESDEKLSNLHPLKGVNRLEFAKYIVNLKQ